MKHTLTILIMLITLTGFSKTVYIDPTNDQQFQDGSQKNPFNSWTDCSLTNGNTYLQKRGTTYMSGIQIRVTDNSVTIGAYGAGNRPIFSYTGSGYAFSVSASYCYISDFEVNGNGTAYALYGSMGSTGEYWQNNKINNCLFENAHNTNNGGFGIYAMYNAGLKVLNTEIGNVALDGIYLAYTPKIEIGYCLIRDVNRRYFINPNQSVSSGDGIQFDGQYNGFWLHHTTVDRTNGAGNKFGVIFNSKAGVSDKATGIIEYCTFRTGVNVSSAVDIDRGRGITIRYNQFKGVTQGLKLAGNTSGNLVHNNTFEGCTSGIGVGYGTTGTRVYNNSFAHTKIYCIWVDRSVCETCNNVTDGTGTMEYNYGGGTFKHVTTCKQF